MKSKIGEDLCAVILLFVVLCGIIIGVTIGEKEHTRSIITYVIHNPDGTQTRGNIVFDDNHGNIYPQVTSSRGTSKLKAPYTILSSNGTIEILSVRHYDSYWEGGPLSKHNRKKYREHKKR